MVLAQQTPVLFLDEPTTVLDLGPQWELLELMETLRSARDLSVVMVLHDLNQAARFCGRLVVLHQRSAVVDGVPVDVLTPALLQDVLRVRARIHADDGVPVAVPHTAAGRLAPAIPWRAG